MLSPTSLIISAVLASERWEADAAQETEIRPDHCSFARREEKKWDTDAVPPNKGTDALVPAIPDLRSSLV